MVGLRPSLARRPDAAFSLKFVHTFFHWNTHVWVNDQTCLFMKTTHDREEVLFREALKRAVGPEREAFLDGACVGDQALRARLEALLQAHEEPDSFFEPPATPPYGDSSPRDRSDSNRNYQRKTP